MSVKGKLAESSRLEAPEDKPCEGSFAFVVPDRELKAGLGAKP
jgi:hypothetical protein